MSIIEKNFVSTRVAAKNNNKNIHNLLHNLRADKNGNYKEQLSTQEKNIGWQKNNMLLFNGNFYNTNKDIALCFKNIELKRQEYIKEHSELYKKQIGNKKTNKKNGNLRNDRMASIAEGILTFSNSINKRLTDDTNTLNTNKINIIDFFNTGVKAIQDIANQHNLEILYITLHLDETTPHFHYNFKNFDNNGKSQLYKIRTKENLSNLQDIAAKPFKKYNLIRGIKKEYTNQNYVKVRNYNSKQQQEQALILNKIKDEIENERKELELLRKEIIKNNEIDNQRKKELYNEIALAKKELDNIKDNIKSYKKDTKEIDIQVKKDINEIISKSKNFIGYDIEIIKKEISNLLKENYNVVNNMYSFIDINTIETKDVEINNLKEIIKNNENTIKNNTKMENLYIKNINKRDEIIKNKDIEIKKYIKEIDNLKNEISNLEIEKDNLKSQINIKTINNTPFQFNKM